MVWAVSLSTTKLRPRRLTHLRLSCGIRSLIGVGNQHLAPSPFSALPPQDLQVAVPQYISGRTSYLHVRLAFHPYPQVIPQFCNTGEFEPRRTVTSASLCPWIAHVVSGRIAATSRLFQTRLPYGSPALALVNLQRAMHSPDHSTKGTPLVLSLSKRQ
jgi:hypothetical protein